VQGSPEAVVAIADAAPLLVTEASVAEDAESLSYLAFWAPASLTVALPLLARRFRNHPLVTQYAARSLELVPESVVVLFLPQIVQTLRWQDPHGPVRRLLHSIARRSESAAHELLWVLITEELPPARDSKLFSVRT
jgi:phosphatidylinositol 4-kinase